MQTWSKVAKEEEHKVKKRLILPSILIMTFAVFCGAFAASGEATAANGGSAGTATGPTSGSCHATDTKYSSTCFGATWRYYETTSNDIVIGNATDGYTHIRDCGKYGGGFYLLALEYFNSTKVDGKRTPDELSYGEQNPKYPIPVRRILGLNYDPLGHAKAPFLEISRGAGKIGASQTNGPSERWDAVKAEFDKAKKVAEDDPNFGGNLRDQKWEDTVYFCWDKDNPPPADTPKESTSSFDAWSMVGKSYTDYVSSVSSGADSYIETNFTTKAEKFTVYFQHRMSYNRPSESGTYESASTTWRTEVTVDGRPYSSDGPTTLTVNDSGPGGGRVLWIDPTVGKKAVEVTVPENGSVKVCSKISYDPKSIKWEGKDGVFRKNGTDGREDSEACAIVSREPVAPPSDPEPIIREEAGQVHFFSRSSVRAITATGKYQQATSYDEGEDTVTLHVSTTNDNIDVDFWHELSYKYEARGGGEPEPIEDKDEFRDADKIKVDWKVFRSDVDRTGGSSVDPDTNEHVDGVEPYNTYKYNTNVGYRNDSKGWTQVSRTGSRSGPGNKCNIDKIIEGETDVVCEKIEFSDAVIELDREQVKRYEKTYSSTKTYHGSAFGIYTRKENDKYTGKRDEDIEDISGGKYIYEDASTKVYHIEHKPDTCKPGWDGEPGKSTWNLCKEGEPEHDEYVAGAKDGEAVYLKTNSSGDNKNAANFSQEGLYENTFIPVSEYIITKNTINHPGFFIQQGDSYVSTSPRVAVFYPSTCQGRWEGDPMNPVWNPCYTGREAHTDYEVYDKSKHGDEPNIVGPEGAQLYEYDYKLVHDHWIYFPVEPQSIEESFSKSCLSVTRPEDPYGPSEDRPSPDTNKVLGPVSGDVSSGFLYAEEKATDVSWDVAAMSYAVRRVMEAQAIVYEPTVEIGPTGIDDISKGNLCVGTNKENGEYERCRDSLHGNSSRDPCAWYTDKVGNRYLRDGACTEVGRGGITNSYQNGYDGGIPFSATHRQELHSLLNTMSAIGVIIPSYVGDKYCNSYGYKLAYWYGITHKNSYRPDLTGTWVNEGGDYWAIYNSACRTIAKKPTMSVWNNGIFTGGSINAVMSSRYSGVSLGDSALNRQLNERKIFGSWAEYLVVPQGEVIGSGQFGFSSGAALGNSGHNIGWLYEGLGELSPLTIANNRPLGQPYGESGIAPRSTYRTRLNAYLKNNTNSNVVQANLGDVLGEHDFSDGKVRVVNTGGITIDDDIIISNSTGSSISSIYDLPQIIIFADGDINIAPNVKRIDAWLISTQNINTCDGFTKGTATNGVSTPEGQGTEARIINYNNDGSSNDNNPVCSNQLTINGPVLAKSITLNRTAGIDQINYPNADSLGSGADARALAGEVFNLGADAYLWSYAQAGRYDSSYTEAYVRELPPRY